MTFIDKRTDVSEWLIHFVRDRCPEGPEDDFPADDEGFDLGGGIDLAPGASAFEVLAEIVKLGGLLPGYSIRNGRTTIYCGKPVVCLTEAPLSNFVRYVQERSNSTRCAPYGVCVLKRELFAAGGRPVIYALAGAAPALACDTPACRILSEERLPRGEQFRYVAYDPNRTVPLDWTHEREWRWVADSTPEHTIFYERHDGADFYEGLPLFLPKSESGHFSRIGFVVKTPSEAKTIAEMLLAFSDAGSNDFDTPYDEQLLRDAFVLSVDETSAADVQRIEDVPETMRVRALRATASDELVQRVQAAIAHAGTLANEAVERCLKTARRTHDGAVVDICGGAKIITYDTTSEVTDALLRTELARAMDGHYVVKVDFDAQDMALLPHQVGAEAAASYLESTLGQRFHVRTWRD